MACDPAHVLLCGWMAQDVFQCFLKSDQDMSSCVSIRVSFLTKELSRHSLCSSADYWRQKFLQKHHTLHISLSSSMFYSVTILSILSSFFFFSFIKQVISLFLRNMQECGKILAKLCSRKKLKEYKNSPQIIEHLNLSSNKRN